MIFVCVISPVTFGDIFCRNVIDVSPHGGVSDVQLHCVGKIIVVILRKHFDLCRNRNFVKHH